ncbi:hypothetical protein PMAYCL1PPCAC_27471, partial [Pristionchus mayeri]
QAMSTPPIDSHTVDQMSVTKDLPVHMTSLSLPSLTPSVDSDSGGTDALCEATGRLTLVDKQKVECHTGLPETSSWETLLWPALGRLCFHLFNGECCTDMDNLSQVYTHYHAGVTEYMKRAGNRPALKRVDMRRKNDAFWVTMELFPSNLRFYGLSTLGERFKRLGRSTKRGLQ